MDTLTELLSLASKITIRKYDCEDFSYECTAWWRNKYGEQKVSLLLGNTVGEAWSRAVEEIRERMEIT